MEIFDIFSPFFSLTGGYSTGMVILAQDPSFSALAFSLYDGKDTIYIGSSSFKLGDSIGFEKIYTACDSLLGQYTGHLRDFGVGDTLSIDKVISEIPPPVGTFSAGLYALDTYILSNLWRTYPSINEMLIVSPSYLGTVHGTAKYAKSDSTRLVKYFINEVLQDDFKIVIQDNVSEKGRVTKGNINNDKAESFLFLLRAFCRYDIKGCRNKIVNEMKGLGHEAEKTLCVR